MSKNLYKQRGSGSWRVRFTLDGQQVNESTGTTILSEAKDYLDKKRLEIREGTFTPRASQRTVTEICEAKQTMDGVNGLKSKKTVDGRWTLHLKPFFGHMRAVHVSTDTITKYVSQRQKEGASNGSIRLELAFLKSAYRLANRSGTIKVVPFIPMPPASPARDILLTDDQYVALGKACSKEGTWLRALLELGCGFGWRKGEILGLRVSQLDFTSRTVHLKVGTTKNKEGRTVTMTPIAYGLLLPLCIGKSPDDFVFTRPGGAPVSNPYKAWHRAIKEAGLKGLRIHDLRRTGATNYINLGVPQKTVMEIGGWKTDNMLRRYHIVGLSQVQAATDKMGERQQEILKKAGIIDGITPVKRGSAEEALLLQQLKNQ
jgi:integrase